MWRSSVAAAGCQNATEISPVRTVQLLFRLSVRSSLSTLQIGVLTWMLSMSVTFL